MRSFVLGLLIVICYIPPFLAFQGLPVTSRRRVPLPRSSSPLHSSDKQDEIARLEEQLKELKKEKEAENVVSVEPTKKGKAEKTSEKALEETPVDMFMTEQWKEGEASDGGGGLFAIIPVVGLAVFLFFFSQVPIGQEDLSKYSTGGNQVTEINLGDLNRARSGDF